MPPSRGRIVAGALVGVAIVVVVAIVAALAITESDGTVAGPDVTTSPGSTTPGPTTSGAPGATTVPPTDLDAAIDEAMAFIQSERQRQFTSRPPVEALDDAAFIARYDALIDEAVAKDPQGIAAATVLYRAFGLIDPDEDIVDVESKFGAAGVLGFYDDERNELVVRGGDITPYFRTVLVHELTPALDDQLVELDRPQDDHADDEVGFGLSAVAEGNARRVELAYRDSLSSDEQRSADREEASYGANFNPDDFHRSFLLLQLAPYDLGEPFVEDLLKAGGEDAVDTALRDPPHTSEQVIDFDKYESKEPRVDVAPPPADGDILDDGVVGQVAIASILGDVMNQSDANRAAEGWGGDWYVVWKQGNTSCARATFVMETSKDLGELSDAFREWADVQPGQASVNETKDQMTLTSCVG